MLIYRLISWLLIAAIGWVVFFFMFRTENEVDPDALDADTAASAEAATEPEPGTRPPSDDPTQPKTTNAATPTDPADTALQGPVPPDPASATSDHEQSPTTSWETRSHSGRGSGPVPS